MTKSFISCRKREKKYKINQKSFHYFYKINKNAKRDLNQIVINEYRSMSVGHKKRKNFARTHFKTSLRKNERIIN